jgi:hypothetical protein
MNNFEKLIKRLKNNYASKISYPDVKATLGNQWFSVKALAKKKIGEMKKTTHKLSKESIKMVLSTTGKVGFGVGRFGVQAMLFCLNKTKAGLYVKVLGLTYLLGRASYVYGTVNEEVITIDSKWAPNSKKDVDEYMVSSVDGKVFKVRNSVWFMRFESEENFSGMKKGNSYKVMTYGLTYPFFNVHPIIVRTHALH